MGLGTLQSSGSQLQSYTQQYSSSKGGSNVVSIVLGSEENGQPSKVTYGGPDSTGYTGETYKYDSTKSDSWTLEVTDVKVNGESVNNLGTASATLDSTQQSILLSEQEYSKFQFQLTYVYSGLTCTPEFCYSTDANLTCADF